MRGYGAALRAELRDLVRHPLVWVSLGAVALSAWLVARNDPIRENGYVVYQSGLLAAAQIAALFLLALAAMSVAGERTRGTVRWILPRPLSRRGFVLGKATAYALLALVLLVVAGGVSLGAALPLGFGDVSAEIEGDEDDAAFHYIEEEVVEPEFQAATMRRRTLYATLLLLPALLTAGGLGILVSCLVRSSAAAVILAVAAALPLNYLPDAAGLAPETARALPFRAATDFLAQLREFGRHFNTAEWPAYTTASLLGAVAGALLLPLLGAAVFERIDLTD